MKPSVYIETTVLGYLAARPQKDVTVAGHQIATIQWWSTAEQRFRLLISQLVVAECMAGDPTAAQERMSFADTLEVLPTSASAESLASLLISSLAVPASEPRDALHIALAAVNGIDYLVTWNLKHIANASARNLIERTCRSAGFEPPVICTPEELMETDDD